MGEGEIDFYRWQKTQEKQSQRNNEITTSKNRTQLVFCFANFLFFTGEAEGLWVSKNSGP